MTTGQVTRGGAMMTGVTEIGIETATGTGTMAADERLTPKPQLT